MRFPWRLRADLLRYRLLRPFSSSAKAPIFRFSPLATQFSGPQRIDDFATRLEWHSPAECLGIAASAPAPVIWIGGAEPLLHPEIGGLARAFTQSGRHVFLHTLGVDLRKRIHEFQPDSRLFFAIEFAGDETVRDGKAGCASNFSRVMESIRAAKLSGFLVCAHVTVDARTDACAVDELFETLDDRDVDGFVVSSGGASYSAALAHKVDEIRGMIRHGGWERFSALLEATCARQVKASLRHKLPGAPTGAFEEAD